MHFGSHSPPDPERAKSMCHGILLSASSTLEGAHLAQSINTTLQGQLELRELPHFSFWCTIHEKAVAQQSFSRLEVWVKVWTDQAISAQLGFNPKFKKLKCDQDLVISLSYWKQFKLLQSVKQAICQHLCHSRMLQPCVLQRTPHEPAFTTAAAAMQPNAQALGLEHGVSHHWQQAVYNCERSSSRAHFHCTPMQIIASRLQGAAWTEQEHSLPLQFPQGRCRRQQHKAQGRFSSKFLVFLRRAFQLCGIILRLQVFARKLQGLRGAWMWPQSPSTLFRRCNMAGRWISRPINLWPFCTPR
mmetsp:Transcript_70709/g.156019  ORF Transcript_70709/g.156019 Transcript_70709/m.156019 type:complete len:301 (+) Transcript_70709:530-1432(+)